MSHVELLSLRYTRVHRAIGSNSLTHEEASEGLPARLELAERGLAQDYHLHWQSQLRFNSSLIVPLFQRVAFQPKPLCAPMLRFILSERRSQGGGAQAQVAPNLGDPLLPELVEMRHRKPILSFRSPLLRETHLLAFPLPIDMLKFGR